MKNILVVFSIVLISLIKSYSQLPSAAQALYDSAYAQDPSMVQFALDSGAQVNATYDGNSFFLSWFPAGSIPASTPVIFTLHGSNGYAFHEFYSWFSRAKLFGCGIIALQWYRPGKISPFDYFPDDTIYSYIDSAFKSINYPSGKAMLHGFSRGAARSYAVILNDILTGNNYFCSTIANSGNADTLYPLYAAIDSGVYGQNVFAGKRWNLFCGGMDMIVGCAKMNFTESWLLSKGASIDIFIQDPNLGHNGFQLPSSYAYKDSIIENYLECYSGVLNIKNEKSPFLHISPNPFSNSLNISSDFPFQNVSVLISDIYGRIVKSEVNISDQKISITGIDFTQEIYFIKVFENRNEIGNFKVVSLN